MAAKCNIRVLRRKASTTQTFFTCECCENEQEGCDTSLFEKVLLTLVVLAASGVVFIRQIYFCMKNRSKNHDNWATPPDYLEKIRKEFGDFFDPCPWNHDINEWNGLEIDWQDVNFINPPYNLKGKTAFVEEVVNRSFDGICLSVMLLPVSTSTKLFHDHIKKYSSEIRFERGRLRFIGINQKGQYVNYDQIQVVTKETIEYKGIEIPKFIKQQGQHDSMTVIF